MIAFAPPGRGAVRRPAPEERDPHGAAATAHAGRIVSELAVITGTTHGIGRVTSRELARAGKMLVMLCRDVTAARRCADEIMRHAPRARIEVVHCDLASLASVREAAAAVRRDYPPLGLLVNNAGMVSTRHRTSVDGFELTFATNHLGPFLLTALLSDHLDKARASSWSLRGSITAAAWTLPRSPTGAPATGPPPPMRSRSLPTSCIPSRSRAAWPAPASALTVCTRVSWPRICCRAGCVSSSRC